MSYNIKQLQYLEEGSRMSLVIDAAIKLDASKLDEYMALLKREMEEAGPEGIEQVIGCKDGGLAVIKIQELFIQFRKDVEAIIVADLSEKKESVK